MRRAARQAPLLRRRFGNVLGPIIVSIDAPRRNRRDFTARWRVEGPRTRCHGLAWGADAWQALQLAMERVAVELRFSAEFAAGPIASFGDPDPMIRLPESLADLGWRRPILPRQHGEVTIREGEAADAPALLALIDTLNAEEPDGRPCTLDHVNTVLLGPRRDVLLRVAELGGEVVGYVTALPAHETSLAVTGLHVADLFVAPAHRGRRIGRALIAAIAAEAQARGGNYVWWTARPDNAAGRRFYEGLGARAEPVRAFMLRDDAFLRLAKEHAA